MNSEIILFWHLLFVLRIGKQSKGTVDCHPKFIKLYQGDEDEGWSKKAIDSLMKKLQKHNKAALPLLEAAIRSEVWCFLKSNKFYCLVD